MHPNRKIYHKKFHEITKILKISRGFTLRGLRSLRSMRSLSLIDLEIFKERNIYIKSLLMITKIKDE
jgi:hypothetical protein